MTEYVMLNLVLNSFQYRFSISMESVNYETLLGRGGFSLPQKERLKSPLPRDSCHFVWNLACLRDLPTPAEARASRRREPPRQRQGLGIWCSPGKGLFSGVPVFHLGGGPTLPF